MGCARPSRPPRILSCSAREPDCPENSSVSTTGDSVRYLRAATVTLGREEHPLPVRAGALWDGLGPLGGALLGGLLRASQFGGILQTLLLPSA